MAKNPNLTPNRSMPPARSGMADELLGIETLRNGASKTKVGEESQTTNQQPVSWFVQVFGGTLLSIMALTFFTIFNYFNNSLADMRREITQIVESRHDLVKKTDLESQIGTVQANFKEVNNGLSSVHALNERSRLLDQQLERQIKTGSEERKDLTSRLEEQRKANLEERKDLTKKLEDVRKILDDERKDTQRKLEDQRKLAEEERKEWSRKLEEARKLGEDHRKELASKLQGLAERMATLEGRQTLKVQPGIHQEGAKSP